MEIDEFVNDTRKIKNAPKAVFIALKAYRDGHDFIGDAYQKGIRYFIISADVDAENFPGAVFIKVEQTLTALQQVAQAHRSGFHFPVIGITGSNGKTIIKEWLGQLLAPDYNIVKSPKSYNSQIGVALSVLKMQPEHELGIFEAGISQPGEMSRLYNMIRPTIGIFTNINEAHNEGFLNERQKINEKLQLFRQADLIVYNKDYLLLHENIVGFTHLVKEDADGLQLFDWSFNTPAMLRITGTETTGHHTDIKALYNGNQIYITIPFKDKAYIENAIHCWCIMLHLRVPEDMIRERMKQLQPIAMRLELKHGINNSIIVNDTYNSDLTSLNIALDFLAQQPLSNRVLILSDMLQIGMPDMEVYNEVVQQIRQKQIQTFIGIGPSIQKHKNIFENIPKLDAYFFSGTEEFIRQISLFRFDRQAVLLKGSRAFRFEKIEKILAEKIHNTVLEINMSDLLHNLNIYRNMLRPDVRLMAMVKAYSYGSGSAEIANQLQLAGVDYLTVAYIDEGIDLRQAGITAPIMVMNPDLQMLDRMIIWNLEPEVYNKNSLLQVMEAVKELDLEHYPVHIKLDTGMHRLGFEEPELEALLDILLNTTAVKVKSIFTHLAGSDSETFKAYTERQHAQYEQLSRTILDALGYPVLRHVSNTAAITTYPAMQYDMVRLGIGLYGIDTTGTIQHKLKPVATLKTHITQIKHLKAGETVGYSRKGVLTRDSRIATVNIGYADGYSRQFGNGKAHMLVNGQPAPLVGVVCMDMCMLDVTDIGDVMEGDEVIVFGKGLQIQQLAAWAGTIPYEILTSISQRVKRIYIND